MILKNLHKSGGLTMLTAQHTKNMTGLLLSGDLDDLEKLYDALHNIVGTEEDSRDLYDVRIRVLGLCYDLRHARMGHRNAAFKPHGLDEEQMKFLSLVGTKQNLSISFETYWPEALYIIFVLNTFIEQYKKRTKAHLWDENIAIVRMFQSTVLSLVEQTITPKQFASFKKWADSDAIHSYSFYKNMYKQYIDYLNLEWIEMDREERVKKFNIFAKRITQHTADYERFVDYMDAAAIEHGVSPDELEYGNYDDLQIIW